MRVEEKRIFISDLPETATQTEIENAFKNYGKVISVEIKERKELGPKNNSLFFAYINIEVDDKHLQQCFQDFSNKKWLGHYVLLQIARESFLDRLRRERESASNTNNAVNLEKVFEEPQQILKKDIANGLKKEIKRKYISSTESDSSDTDAKSEDKKEPIITQDPITKQKKVKRKYKSSTESDSSDTDSKRDDKIQSIGTQDTITKGKKVKSSSIGIKDGLSTGTNESDRLIIKNNKGKVIDKSGLKIESVGNKPIIVIDKSKKVPVNSSEANLKRLQSLNNMRKNYQNQKALIQAALSKIDSTSKTKIIFDENIGNTSLKKLNKVDKKSRSINLFDDDPNEDEEFEANFSIKEQYQSKEGQKLLELQSKYKNDKRFVLDERFLDKSETSSDKNKNNEEENEDVSLEEEKKKEYEILEQVLGKKINSKFLHQRESQNQKKSMLRFDPSQPEHSKFEIKREQGNRKKKHDPETELLNEKNQDEKEMPAVSKEIFYKVTDNLKENLHVEQGFSLLSMFGQKHESKEGEQMSDELSKLDSNTSGSLMGKNPFRYDSSDDEDETETIPNKHQQEVEKPIEQVQTNINRSNFWSESFFFNTDDYKFQDGFDFIEKMKSEDKNEFTKLRRDLKDIVKTKVRNNQRKHKPFKKKLGGSKRKKMIKMKKALKR